MTGHGVLSIPPSSLLEFSVVVRSTVILTRPRRPSTKALGTCALSQSIANVTAAKLLLKQWMNEDKRYSNDDVKAMLEEAGLRKVKIRGLDNKALGETKEIQELNDNFLCRGVDLGERKRQKTNKGGWIASRDFTGAPNPTTGIHNPNNQAEIEAQIAESQAEMIIAHAGLESQDFASQVAAAKKAASIKVPMVMKRVKDKGLWVDKVSVKVREERSVRMQCLT